MDPTSAPNAFGTTGGGRREKKSKLPSDFLVESGGVDVDADACGTQQEFIEDELIMSGVTDIDKIAQAIVEQPRRSRLVTLGDAFLQRDTDALPKKLALIQDDMTRADHAEDVLSQQLMEQRAFMEKKRAAKAVADLEFEESIVQVTATQEELTQYGKQSVKLQMDKIIVGTLTTLCAKLSSVTKENRRFGSRGGLECQEILQLFNITNSDDVYKLNKIQALSLLKCLSVLGYQTHSFFRGLWAIPPHAESLETFIRRNGATPWLRTGTAGLAELQRRIVDYLAVPLASASSSSAVSLSPSAKIVMSQDELDALVAKAVAEATSNKRKDRVIDDDEDGKPRARARTLGDEDDLGDLGDLMDGDEGDL